MKIGGFHIFIGVAASVAITYKTVTLEDSEGRSHNVVVKDTITHLTSLIQSANEETSRI